MPIELWWWVKPLFETGFFTLVLLGPIAAWMGNRAYWIGLVLACIAVAPYVVTIVSALVWLLCNVMLLIWR